jgi:CheY-like chemotaxis protein
MQNDKRVLVFDDDEDLLIIFRFLFEDNGWEVHTAQTCDEVIERVQEVNPALILMDNWIPTIGGIAATQLLKGNPMLKAIPVIYISANNDIDLLAAKAGADAFMAKPFNLDAIYDLAVMLTNKKPR